MNSVNVRNASFIVILVLLACFLFGYYLFTTLDGTNEPLEIYTSVNGE